jgi:predicted small lipoprotein YifL
VKKLVLLAVFFAAACGKKGPPLAPFVRVPAPVANVTAQRVGDDIYLSIPVPTANVDGQQPADIASLEVYAITATSPPETDEQRKLATLVVTLPVQPIMPVLPPPPAGAEVPAIPPPPGVDRSAPAIVRETLTAEMHVAVPLPPIPGALPVLAAPDEETVVGPLVTPAPTQLPRRYYFVVGVSSRGRKAPASPPVPVPLESATSAPAAPQVTFTEAQMTITWSPSKDARSSVFLEPPPPPKPVVPVPAVPGAVPPAPTAPRPITVLPPLPAKSLGFQSEATTYNLFEVPSTAAAENPFAVQVPTALTPAPLVVTEHVIQGVTFGVERCFVVRAVDKIAGATVMGPASAKTCVTPADTFPPAAPRSLAAIAGDGVISLIWEPNAESDLAGYLVLRGDAPGDTLRAITPEPVTATAYRDTTARPGTRYVYVVVAVDRATPQNVSAQSNRVEEMAR